jgi:uncharacterized coiled-coil DUF342 family protein
MNIYLGSTLISDISIISSQRDKWIKKRIILIEKRDEIRNEGNDILAEVYELLIDQSQEIINDLSESIQKMQSMATYNKNCETLINNLTKK